VFGHSRIGVRLGVLAGRGVMRGPGDIADSIVGTETSLDERELVCVQLRPVAQLREHIVAVLDPVIVLQLRAKTAMGPDINLLLGNELNVDSNNSVVLGSCGIKIFYDKPRLRVVQLQIVSVQCA
jgi:hypothetical protein